MYSASSDDDGVGCATMRSALEIIIAERGTLFSETAKLLICYQASSSEQIFSQRLQHYYVHYAPETFKM